MPGGLPWHPDTPEPEVERPPAMRYDGGHELNPSRGYEHRPGVTTPATGSDGQQIKVDPERLRSWSTMFDDVGGQLNGVGDTMYRMNVKPGYFTEANMIRDLVKTFNGTFIPNARILADAALYIGQGLRLVADDFSGTEKANLDGNNQLVDVISSLTKVESGLKPVQGVQPKT